jgi:hypothetical protein
MGPGECFEMLAGAFCLSRWFTTSSVLLSGSISSSSIHLFHKPKHSKIMALDRSQHSRRGDDRMLGSGPHQAATESA